MGISSKIHKINCRYCLREIDEFQLNTVKTRKNKTRFDSDKAYSHRSCYEAVKNYNFSRYNGEILPLEEIDFLLKMEEILEQPMPYVKKFRNAEFGFSIKNNRIDTINLYNLGLDSIPVEINNLSKLRILKANYNKISVFPDFNGLQCIEKINLSNNQIVLIPESISNLQNIRSIILGQNKISHLPVGFSRLKNLEEIDLHHNLFHEFPKELFFLVKLKSIYLSNNMINKIPSEINSLINLKMLNIMHNKIAEFPCISNLKNLIKLNISYNEIDSIPSSDEISSIPDSLQEIKIYHNKLDSIQNFFLIPNLILLDAGNNRITEFPQKILCKKLTTLRLDGNLINCIPKEIANLDQLRTLSLERNLLRNLPLEFTRLKSLEFIFIQRNKISQLPDLSNMHNLKRIYLLRNWLWYIPSYLWEKTELKELYNLG